MFKNFRSNSPRCGEQKCTGITFEALSGHFQLWTFSYLMHRIRQEGLKGPAFACRFLFQSVEQRAKLLVLLALSQDLESKVSKSRHSSLHSWTNPSPVNSSDGSSHILGRCWALEEAYQRDRLKTTRAECQIVWLSMIEGGSETNI